MDAAAVEETHKITAMGDEWLISVEMLISELSHALGVHSRPDTAGLCLSGIHRSKPRSIAG
jgi:hypothetical protein